MTMSKTVKRAKSAKPVKGTKAKAKTKKVALKLIKITPVPNRTILERGSEFIALRNKGFSQSDVITMFKNAGIDVSTPAYYNAIKIASAPKDVRDAIREGKVAPTLVLPFLKKKLSTKQISERLAEVVTAREQHATFLKKSGFGDGKASKLTMGRIVAVVRQRLEKLKKSKSLSDARGQAVLAVMQALEKVHDAKGIEALVAEFSGKAKK